jgi:hypothetical protein
LIIWYVLKVGRAETTMHPFFNICREMVKRMNLQNKNSSMASKKPDGIYNMAAKSVIFVLIPLMFLHFSLINIADKGPVRKVAFEPGEKLTYKGRWGIIPAGEITLEVLPKQTIKGVEAYHFAMTTKTNEAVDLVYKIRERQDSYVDMGITRSLYYKKKTESEHPRDENIDFDWDKQEATYTNFGQTRPPIHILPGSFDPLALFYVLRSHNLKENSTIYIPLTDGNLNIEVRATVGKRDVIEIAGRTYDTIEVTPNMETLNKVDQIIKKSGHPQLKVWLTTDDKKIPIKIQSKVGIISFDFEIEPGPS